jgi:hypothetical protein
MSPRPSSRTRRCSSRSWWTLGQLLRPTPPPQLLPPTNDKTGVERGTTIDQWLACVSDGTTDTAGELVVVRAGNDGQHHAQQVEDFVLLSRLFGVSHSMLLSLTNLGQTFSTPVRVKCHN